MRKRLLYAVPPLVLIGAAGTWLFLARTTDPVAAAKRLIALNDMKGASLYLREAVRAQPANPEAAFLLGKADLALGNPAEARLELSRAREHGYNQAAIVLPLGQAYLQLHNYSQLLQDFTPDTAPPGTQAETLSLRAAAQMATHDLDAATASANAALTLAPENPYVLLAAARVALVRGDQSEAAAKVAKILSAAEKPDEATRDDALLLQGELAMRRNDPQSALASARSVISASPTRLDARLLEARALAATGQAKAARSEVDAVLHRAPRDVSANFLRIVIALHAADYAAADASLQRIGPAIADLPRGFYFLAVAKLGLQQYSQAEEAAAQFLAQAPDDISGLKLMAFIDLARVHPDRTLSLLHDSALSTHQDADTYDLRGRALAMTGDLKGAQQDLAKAAELHPSDPSLLNRLAAVEMDLGNIPAGEADLKQSLELSPKQGRTGAAIVEADLARFDLAAAHRDLDQLRKNLGDVQEIGVLDAQMKLATLDTAGAETELRTLRKRFPDSRATVLLLAQIENLAGDTADANALLETALSKHPADSGLLGLLLPSLLSTNQTPKAVSLAAAAHDASPTDPVLTATLAEVYVRAGQPDRAIGLLDRASAGTNATLDLMRAGIEAQDGKPAAASSILQTVLDRSPGNIRARLLLSALQLKSGDADAARATLRDGLKQTPGDAALLDQLVGIDLKQASSPQAGLKAGLATAAALRANPANQPAAYSLPGELYLAAGDAKSAASAFLAAYKAAPSSELAVKAATAAARAGNAPQGAALLQAWTGKHPADAAALLVLSSFYLESGRLAPAASCLQSVLDTDSTNAAALNNLAWIRQRQGNTAEAKTLAERAYFVSPGAEMADTLGWILAQQGDTSAALPLLKQATFSTVPSLHAAASYHYAVALAAAGQRDAARAQVQSALASPAAFRERDDAITFFGTLK